MAESKKSPAKDEKEETTWAPSAHEVMVAGLKSDKSPEEVVATIENNRGMKIKDRANVLSSIEQYRQTFCGDLGIQRLEKNGKPLS